MRVHMTHPPSLRHSQLICPEPELPDTELGDSTHKAGAWNTPLPPSYASLQLLWYFPAHCQTVKSTKRQSAVQLMITAPGEVQSSFKRSKCRGNGDVGGAEGDALVLGTKASSF